MVMLCVCCVLEICCCVMCFCCEKTSKIFSFSSCQTIQSKNEGKIAEWLPLCKINILQINSVIYTCNFNELKVNRHRHRWYGEEQLGFYADREMMYLCCEFIEWVFLITRIIILLFVKLYLFGNRTMTPIY